MTVYFIGAGPGDPELITVKGQRLLRSCPVILYAGSLVPAAVLEGHGAEQVINTAELHLDEIIELIRQAHGKGQDVARVHSGDPSLYGAIGEQIRHLRRLAVPFQIIPGVTATAACAALLESELTLPEVSQTLILTRYASKSNMPEGEALGDLARHGATMAIHLGVVHLSKIVAELLPHYGADCPIAVIHRASWPDQDWVSGTLTTIEEQVRAKGFRRTALILVGRVLHAEQFADSALYNAEHRHLFRSSEAQRDRLVFDAAGWRGSGSMIVQLAPGEFIEVFVDTPLAICEQRDPKGLYRQARAGVIKDFTGVDSPYEVPETAELTLTTETQSVEACIAELLGKLGVVNRHVQMGGGTCSSC